MVRNSNKPEGWEKLLPMGKGDAQVGFCKETRRNYVVGRNQEIIWHDVPEGFEFDDSGMLKVKEVIENG